jgi:hypothetical protein
MGENNECMKEGCDGSTEKSRGGGFKGEGRVGCGEKMRRRFGCDGDEG